MTERELIDVLIDCIFSCHNRAWGSGHDDVPREQLESRARDIHKLTRDAIATHEAWERQ